MVREMKQIIFIKILFITLFIFNVLDVYAYNVVMTGKAVVTNNQLRSAYHNALNNALLGSIRYYYKEEQQQTEVNAEYLKFIKSYTILSQTLSDNTVSIKVRVDLDDSALQDAKLLLNQYSDSAVYVFRGIDNSMLINGQIASTISSILTSKQFSLANQSDFLGKITDVNNDSQIQDAFSESSSKYLIFFEFKPITSLDEFNDSSNLCEITTIVTIIDKNNKKTAQQITTGSQNTDTARCYNEAIKRAVSDTIGNARENIVQLPETAAKLRKYKIKILNAGNLVLTKNIIDTFTKRGLIKTSKALSYTQKSVVFEVESYFSTEELSNKVKNTQMPVQPTQIDFSSDELLLDFAKEN